MADKEYDMTKVQVFDDALYEVLALRRYDRLMGRRFDFWGFVLERLERLVEWIVSRINFDGDITFNTSVIAAIFGVVGIILASVAAIVILRSLFTNRKARSYNLHEVFQELDNRSYTVHELISLSNSVGNERFAVRYRYIAALLILNEKRVIKIEPSATNKLIEKQIKEHAPHLGPLFEEIADVFHLSWFGFKKIADDDFISFVNSIDQLGKDGMQAV